jgi:hypothetical protein
LFHLVSNPMMERLAPTEEKHELASDIDPVVVTV